MTTVTSFSTSLEYTMEAALSPAYWDRKVAAAARASSREGTTGALLAALLLLLPLAEEAREAASKLDAEEVLLTISMSSSIEAPRADDDDDADADLVLACTNGDRGRFPRLACAADAAEDENSPPEEEKGDEANAAAVLDARCLEETAPPARRLVGLRLLIDLLGVCAGAKAVTPPPDADAARNTARANFGSFILLAQGILIVL